MDPTKTSEPQAEVKDNTPPELREGFAYSETPEQKAKREAYNEKARIRNAARRAAKRAVRDAVEKSLAEEDQLHNTDNHVDADPAEAAVVVAPKSKKARKAKKARSTFDKQGFIDALNHDDRKMNSHVRGAAHGVQTVLHGAIPASTLQWLQKEADAMVEEFLGKQFDVPLPVIAVSIDTLNKKCLAKYHPDRDGMGLRWRVDVNYRSLGRSQLVVVATLLHEIMHAVQNDHGYPGHKNFHNNEFQAWTWWLGIPTDEGGHFLGVYPHSLFSEYAKERGLDGDCPVVEEHQKIPKAPGSPLKKWTCGCGTNARVATMFDATCNLCETKFELQEAGK